MSHAHLRSGMKIAIVSGHFNPLHVGHIAYMEAARSCADALWVIVANDIQVALKGRKSFMLLDDRMKIVESLRVVDRAFASTDMDRSSCASLRFVGKLATDIGKTIYVNGGDSTKDSIPKCEIDICNELGIELVFGIVPQIAQSSAIIESYESSQNIERQNT